MQVPDYSDPTPAYVQIAEDLREQIRAGTYAPGARLASNKSLSAQYGVADGTIRQALEELRKEGLVATQSTRGTFVVNKPGETTEEMVRRLASGLDDALRRLDKVEQRLTEAEQALQEDGR